MKDSRIEFLDSLRGLAAITVIIGHFVLAYRLDLEFKYIYYSPLHFFFDGFAAVTLFFVLSGYVLTLSLEKRDNVVLADFYLKRVFRIMPAYIVTLLISLLLYFFFNNIHTTPESSAWINSFWIKPLDLISFLRQVIFLRTDGFVELVAPNWSLNIEMQFSFLLPFLFFLHKKTNFIFFFFFILILAIFFGVHVFIFLFSLGVCLALNQSFILQTFSVLKSKHKILLFLLTIFLYTYRYTVPIYYLHFFREFNFLNNDGLIWIITGLGSFLILLYCFTTTKIQNVLNIKFVRYIGKLSYTLYLTHFFILIFMVPFFIHKLNDFGLTEKYIIWVLSLIFLLITTTAISHLLNKFVEIQFVRLGNNIIKKYILPKSI